MKAVQFTEYGGPEVLKVADRLRSPLQTGRACLLLGSNFRL